MRNQKIILYIGATIIVTVSMLLIKGITHLFNNAVVTMLQ